MTFPSALQGGGVRGGGSGDRAPRIVSRNSVKIVQDLVIPEANHAIAASRQLHATALIGLLAKRMLPTVQLNRQLPLGTREINNSPSDRMLAAKFPCRQPITEGEP